MFLRPAYNCGKDRSGRPRKKEKGIGCEIPEFPKPLAPALRFGSMNPISRLLGRWAHGGKTHMVEFRFVSGQKVMMWGVSSSSSSSSFVLIAEMKFRPVVGWPKRSYYGELGVENDVFEASL